MRILDVGPWIAYPPRRGRAARAYELLLALAAKHDVRHFGRVPRRRLSRERFLEEVPVTPMFRVFRCRYPLAATGGGWLLRHERDRDAAERLVRRATLPRRYGELLEWADVVLAEDPLELALARREGSSGRLVYVAHDVGEPSTVSAAGYDQTAEAVASTAVTVAQSAADRDVLVERYGADPDRVAVVPNAVDAERFRPADADVRTALRRELGLPEGPLVAVPAGESPTGREALAWSRRLAAHGGLTFLVAGAATRPGREAGLVATGPVRDLVPYLRAADLAFVPVERTGGTPLALLETLACGLPVVAFPGALRGTDLRDGEHVVVCDPGEQAALDALSSVAADPDLAARHGSAGRAFVEPRTWKQAAMQLVDALARLVTPAGSAGPVPAPSG